MAAVLKKNKLLFYILVNILISTTTVLGVLWIWERTHPLPEVDPKYLANPQQINFARLTTSKEAAPNASTPTPILSQDQIQLSVEGVFAVGVEQMEYVLIRNHSAVGIDLLGWQLSNGRGDTYTFPALTLNADGRVKLLTGVGTNSVIELYWGLPKAIWHSGDTVTIKDINGVAYAAYQIP